MKLLFLTVLVFSFQQLFGQSNEAHIEQVGNFHNAQIEQEAATGIGDSEHYTGKFTGKGVDGVPNGRPFNENNNGLGDSGSVAEIFQFDTGNMASIYQAGDHWAQIFQIGLNNIAAIDQDGSSGGGVSFNPPGVANPCPPPFAPCEGSSEDGSIASIYQEGERNSATIEQEIGSNEANITQYGSDTEAIIHQFGNNNFASILQDFRGVASINNLSGYRSAEILQTNNNNTATVEQYVPTENPIQIIQDGTGAPVHIEHY